MTDFTQLFVAATSPDNEQRRQAEQMIQQMTNQPGSYLPQLLIFANAEKGARNDLRLFALTQICNLLDKIKTLREVFNDSQLKELCNAFLTLCKTENDMKNVSKLSDCVTTFAYSLQEEKYDWSDYFNCLLQLTSVDSLVQQSVALDCMGKSTGHISASLLLTSMKELAQHIQKCLSSDNLMLRLKAITFLNNSFNYLERSKECTLFINLYPQIWDTIQKVVVQNNEDALKSIYDDLQELCEMTKYFKTILQIVMDNSLQVLSNTNNNDIKQRVMEFILDLIQYNTKFFKKTNYISQVLLILLDWSTQVHDEDVELWNSNDVDDMLFNFASDAIETLILSTGGKVIQETLFNKCIEYIKMSDWQHRYAALNALSKSVEGGKYVLKNNIKDLMSIGFNCTQDGQPLVVYSFVSLISELLDAFPKIMIRNFLESIVKVLIACMNIKLSKIQENMCYCLNTMMDNIEGFENNLKPFVQNLLDGLLQSITQLTDKKDISNVFTCYIYLTLIDPQQAGNEYQKLSQVVNVMLPQCKDESTGEIKGKIIELMSIYYSTINAQCFTGVEELIYNSLCQLFQQEDSISDPSLTHILASICRLCDGNVKPHLDQFIPLLLTRLSKPIKSDDSNDETGCVNVENATTEEKRVILTTIKRIAMSTKKEFGQFSVPTFNVIKPLLLYNNDIIRFNAIVMLPIIISTVIEMAGITDDVKIMSYEIMKTLCNMSESCCIDEDLDVIFEQVESIVPLLGENGIDEQTVNSMFVSFDKALENYFDNEKDFIPEGLEDDDADGEELDEEEVDMLNDLSDDDKWLQRMLNILTLICKNERQAFINQFNYTLFPKLMLYFNDDSNEDTCSFAVSAFGIIITEGKVFDYLTNIGDKFIQYCLSQKSDIAFNALLFTGLFVELEIPTFVPFLQKTFDVLLQILNYKKNKLYHELHCQVVVTLGQIILHFPSLPNKAQLIGTFLNLLPVNDNYDKIIEIIFNMQSTGLLATSNDNDTALLLLKLTTLCADALENNCTIDTKKRILQLLGVWNSSINRSIIESVWAKLSYDQRDELADLQKTVFN